MPPIRTLRRQLGRSSESESRRTRRRCHPYPRPDAARGPSTRRPDYRLSLRPPSLLLRIQGNVAEAVGPAAARPPLVPESLSQLIRVSVLQDCVGPGLGLEEPNMRDAQNVDRRPCVRWDAHACLVAASILIILIILSISQRLSSGLIDRSRVRSGHVGSGSGSGSLASFLGLLLVRAGAGDDEHGGEGEEDESGAHLRSTSPQHTLLPSARLEARSICRTLNNENKDHLRSPHASFPYPHIHVRGSREYLRPTEDLKKKRWLRISKQSRQSFADVPTTSSGVPTKDFLEASDGLVQLFDLFGSAVFGFVQNDIKGNVHGVRTRFNAAPDVSQTLESLLEHDTPEPHHHGHGHKGHGHATGCLIRLLRYVPSLSTIFLSTFTILTPPSSSPLTPLLPSPSHLRTCSGLAFTHLALQNMQDDPHAELHICFKKAYDVVLKHHHAFFVRSVVAVAIRAVPYRADFYARLLQGGDRAKLDAELGKWLHGLDAVVRHMSAVVEKGGYGKV
ncbi:hypothetical protein CCMSSC00406_0007837 [Pleurotus cornucopiae]|uniref:Uncharacterized protein n=1 Tax=Pleurotus cornucopiae TaxID=5321 RepID=A0ACB7J2Z5_PLECO|nr:hypothetical protein CCMSSC00406_0007837 [Pleurotus cornucopiae]